MKNTGHKNFETISTLQDLKMATFKSKCAAKN